MKLCTGCNRTKKLAEFSRNARMKDGLQRRCKSCRREEYLKYSNPPRRRGVAVDAESKMCYNCDTEKGRDQFYVDQTSPSKMSSWCIDCCVRRERENRLRNRCNEYGITVDQYLEMLRDQDYRCANSGCRVHEADSARGTLYIDHCHETGKVRGLLCNRCNTAEGFLLSDVKIEEGMVEYLRGNNFKKEFPGMTWYEVCEEGKSPNKR